MFGIIGAQGIALQIARKVNMFDPRKLAVIATVLVIGIGGAIGYEGGMIPFQIGTLIDWQLPAIATAAVVGILLNLVFIVFPARRIDEEFERVKIDELKLDV